MSLGGGRGCHAGRPRTWRCKKCRSRDRSFHYGMDDDPRVLENISLRTGREKPAKLGNLGGRDDWRTVREVICGACKHKGWSAHPDCARFPLAGSPEEKQARWDARPAPVDPHEVYSHDVDLGVAHTYSVGFTFGRKK